MRRLTAFSTLPREGPSVRPRVLAYGPALLRSGIRLSFCPFLSSRGFAGFYSTRWVDRLRKIAHGALGAARRAGELTRLTGSGGVLVHREFVPRGNRVALSAVRRRGLPLAYDLDDAIYLSPRDYVDVGETSHRRMSRVKDPREVDSLISAADMVLAGNETIAEHAAALCKDVRVQPTPVDTDLYRPRARSDRDRPLVGWIGSPTATYCLRSIAPALTRAAQVAPFDLLVVGAGEAVPVPGVGVIDRNWRLDDEAELFSSLDIGLYPIPDNPWTRGKCGMKALQYGASEVAAVVAPVGVNKEIVDDGVTGRFATTEEEWVDCLVAYLRDPAQRREHGRAARRRVHSQWSLEALTPTFVTAMEDLVR